MKRLLGGWVALSLFVGIPASVDADYIFTTLDVPSTPIAALARGINDDGQIVGTYFKGDRVSHGFLLSNGTLTTLDVPSGFGTVNTIPDAINASGQIVGHYQNSTGAHGFLLSGGSYTRIDVPGGVLGNTAAYGINASGQIVGQYTTLAGTRGFLLTNGMYTTLNVPHSDFTIAWSINRMGVIVGNYGHNFADQHGFLLRDDTYTTLDAPGSTLTFAQGINDVGQIGGYYQTGTVGVDARIHGFLLFGASYTTLDVPGAAITTILSINNLGQVVGQYKDSDGIFHTFLGTPTPEPSTLLLLTIGVLGMIGWTRRRHR